MDALLETGFHYLGSETEPTQACKSTTALLYRACKSNGKDPHAFNPFNIYIFFPHWFRHTCNVHGKIKLASNARQVKLIEPYHNSCSVPFYVVFFSVHLSVKNIGYSLHIPFTETVIQCV